MHKSIFNLLMVSFVSILLTSCLGREKITIVDISKLNRDGIAQQLEIINQNNPKVIGLDIFFYYDSMERDDKLIDALGKVKNIVSVVGLANYNADTNTWDSLTQSHPKFQTQYAGYANIAVRDEYVVDPSLLLDMPVENKMVSAFSKVLAEQSFGLKAEYASGENNVVSFKVQELGKGYNIISADNLFAGKYSEKDLKGRIVLLGYVGGTEDYYFINRSKTRGLSGVEYHASVLSQLIK